MGNDVAAAPTLATEPSFRWEVWMGDTYWTYADQTQKLLYSLGSGCHNIDVVIIEPQTEKEWRSHVSIDLDRRIQKPDHHMRQVSSSSDTNGDTAESLISRYPSLESLWGSLREKHEPWGHVALWVMLEKPPVWEDGFPLWIQSKSINSLKQIDTRLEKFERLLKQSSNLFFEKIYLAPLSFEGLISLDKACALWKEILCDWKDVSEWISYAQRTFAYWGHHISKEIWINVWELRFNRTRGLPSIVLGFLVEKQKNVDCEEMMEVECENPISEKPARRC